LGNLGIKSPLGDLGVILLTGYWVKSPLGDLGRPPGEFRGGRFRGVKCCIQKSKEILPDI
jgi:hypothetical protein